MEPKNARTAPSSPTPRSETQEAVTGSAHVQALCEKWSITLSALLANEQALLALKSEYHSTLYALARKKWGFDLVSTAVRERIDAENPARARGRKKVRGEPGALLYGNTNDLASGLNLEKELDRGILACRSAVHVVFALEKIQQRLQVTSETMREVGFDEELLDRALETVHPVHSVTRISGGGNAGPIRMG